jgi:hypothetical protein
MSEKPVISRPTFPIQRRYDPMLGPPQAQIGPQGTILQINALMNLPFKGLIAEGKMPDEVLLQMAAEIMDEIKKRGLKF